MGTTYYFTVCSYVTNIGNGTAYNVNAKTSGFIITDGPNLYNGAVKYGDTDIGTDCIYHVQTSSNVLTDDLGLTFSPSISLSGYTKLCVDCKPSVQGKYTFPCFWAYIDGESGVYCKVLQTSLSSTSGTRQTWTFDISKNGTMRKIIFYLSRYASGSEGFASFTCYIYKIWLE